MRETASKFQDFFENTVWILIIALFGISSVCVEASVNISNVSVDRDIFNPTKGEQVVISYKLSEAAKVTLKIYAPDDGLIKGFSHEKKAGEHQQTWDGKDESGNIVPDEAYRFTIEAEDSSRHKALYDTKSTLGRYISVKDFGFDAKKGVFHYTLPKPARVRIHIGIKHGPVLRTLVNWQPRLKGLNEEVWDSKDQSGFILSFNPFWYQDVFAYSLPENSIITTGNNKLTWAEYRKARGETGSRLKNNEIKAPDSEAQPPIAQCRIPSFRLSLVEDWPRTETGISIVSGSCSIRVELAEEDTDWLTELEYEILFFVDNVYIHEEEKGYTPYVWTWDLKSIKEGEHLITVNVLSYKGHIEIKSLKVYVKEP